MSQLKVEQVCGKFKNGNWGDGDEDGDDQDDEDNAITSDESAMTAFRGAEQHTVRLLCMATISTLD